MIKFEDKTLDTIASVLSPSYLLLQLAQGSLGDKTEGEATQAAEAEPIAEPEQTDITDGVEEAAFDSDSVIEDYTTQPVDAPSMSEMTDDELLSQTGGTSNSAYMTLESQSVATGNSAPVGDGAPVAAPIAQAA